MSLATEVMDLEAEVEELRQRVDGLKDDDGQVADAIKTWQLIHPEARRDIMNDLADGGYSDDSDAVTRGREALLGLLEALE